MHFLTIKIKYVTLQAIRATKKELKMKKTLSLLLFLMCFVCCICAQTNNKTHRTWAQYERYEKANKALIKSPKVVFMGNSITDFWAKIMPEFFEENNYVGRGISGQTTQQMLSRFRQDVVALNPKVVVILAGINDIAQNNGEISNANILQNIAAMCDIAKANDITPVLCSILPCDYFSWKPELRPSSIVKDMNELIRSYAKSNGYSYVDYYAKMSTRDGALKAEYTKDRCHPIREGYEVMQPIVQKVLHSILLKK